MAQPSGITCSARQGGPRQLPAGAVLSRMLSGTPFSAKGTRVSGSTTPPPPPRECRDGSYCPPTREPECQLLQGLTKVSSGEDQFLSTSVGPHISLPEALPVWPLSWPLGLPVEEAGLAPKHHHHIAARVQVGACDGDLCTPRHGSSVGLQICEGQSLHREEEN